MLERKQILIASMLALFSFAGANACHLREGGEASSKIFAESSPQYSWTQVTTAAAFPGSYNFPVFMMRDQMWAFHPQGNWSSFDGKMWIKSGLPSAGLNSGYQKYLKFNDAIYALGTMEGDYTNMRLTSRIARTNDFKRWEILAEKSELPARVFYGALVFKDKMWLMGGFDGKNYYNDVWNSTDGVHWRRVAEHAAWSERNAGVMVAFKDRMWMFGGGLIDGTPSDGRAGTEVWSSGDGINWSLMAESMKSSWGGSPIVYDGKLWLVGANRDGSFSRAVLETDDGVTWREHTAPWSPRGGAATWVFDGKLYMTGGKFSMTERGEIKFIYSNDVWYMNPSASATKAF